MYNNESTCILPKHSAGTENFACPLLAIVVYYGIYHPFRLFQATRGVGDMYCAKSEEIHQRS